MARATPAERVAGDERDAGGEQAGSVRESLEEGRGLRLRGLDGGGLELEDLDGHAGGHGVAP